MYEKRVEVSWSTGARIIAQGSRLAITAALQQARGAVAMPFNNGAWLSRRNTNISNTFAIAGNVSGDSDPVAQALGSIRRNETSKLLGPRLS